MDLLTAQFDPHALGRKQGVETATPGNTRSEPVADHNRFVNLTAYERRRIYAVLEAMPAWDPAAVLVAETEAHALLYSDSIPSSAPHTTYSARRGARP
ncbi:MAG: DUF6400 family protein [Actinomycetota bacterium]|nr:DUF6400 family protein [Actinomycetota bacterium]